MELEKIAKQIKNSFPEIEIEGDEDVYAFLNIYGILKAAYSNVDDSVLKKAYSKRSDRKLENANDYYFLVFESMLEENKISKVAYPIGMGALKEDPMEEADLTKWSKLVHKIYDAVSSGEMSFENALDYYSGSLDIRSGEDDRFKKWVKYYKDGEHLKYSSKNKDENAKVAYQFPLNSSGYYPHYSKPELDEEDSLLSEMENSRKKDQYSDWKQKLHAAIRRIDKLLRQSDEYLDVDMQSELADQLHNLDMEVRKVRMKSTASDLVHRAANNFQKKGFQKGHDLLISFAQEVPEEETPIEEIAPEPDLTPEVPPAETTPETIPETAPEEAKGGKSAITDAIIGESTAEPGEYAELAGEVSLEQAAKKLEQIAGRLADRRTIRLLAEFDIMLDKLGIASMFPELAEAQSKLIDSYSYALVRVTKMLGMLASGKSLAEISTAKTDEISRKTMKEVDKTFQGAPEEEPKGTEAIQREFAEEAEAPAPAPAPET